MGLFDRFKKKRDEPPRPSDLDIILGKTGQVDRSLLSDKMAPYMHDQEVLQRIARESTLDQARMWAAGALEDKELANEVYGALRFGSQDVLIRMAASQEYRPPEQKTE